MPMIAGPSGWLTLSTAFETPLPSQRFLSPSRSSIASCSPVDAPLGTAARPLPARGLDLDFDRGVAARIEDVAGEDGGDLAHFDRV